MGFYYGGLQIGEFRYILTHTHKVNGHLVNVYNGHETTIKCLTNRGNLANAKNIPFVHKTSIKDQMHFKGKQAGKC